MKKIIVNQTGVTLIETVAATAIVAIILISIVGALLYGQKMIVFTDTKNNAASQAQEMVDDIMGQLGAGTGLSAPVVEGAMNVSGAFFTPSADNQRKQYYYAPVNISGVTTTVENAVGYRIYARVYYNNGMSYIELEAFAKKGSVFL